MEEIQKVKQYEYRQNSNLVLTDTSSRSREAGPSGEVITLREHLNIDDMKAQMGSRALKERPPEFEEQLKRAKQKREEREEAAAKRQRGKQQARVKSTVLSADVDAVYRPQTKETKAAYEVFLNFIQQELGDKPHDVLRSAADEILHVVKRDDGSKNAAKQKEVESLFRRQKPLTEDRWKSLVNICGKLTDFTDTTDMEAVEEKEKEGELDEEHGVPVVFEEEDEENQNQQGGGVDEINDEDEGDEGIEAVRDFAIEAKIETGQDGMIDEDEEKDNELDARTVDAYWLQRELSKFYSDAHMSQKMSSDVFDHLNTDEPDRNVENKLVLLLDYDKFPFIKLLLRNRLKIVWCMKRSHAKDDKEKDTIEAEMLENPKLRPILEALHRTTTAAERNIDLEKKMIKEARNLSVSRKLAAASITKEDVLVSDDVFWNKRPKAMIDLEAITFEAGGHFMSNKEVKLPQSSEVINKKGYQEVHIPPVKAHALPGEKVILIPELPKWAQKGFAGMERLNRIQSRIYETAMNTPENMLLCAPTGAGKTNCAMLTIMREIGLNLREDGSVNTDAFKIVYVAPMKSLVQEMVLNFGKRLEPYGMTVRELSGDSQLTKQQINETQLIVTTPEKWDIITRKAGDRTYTQLVSLVIIDEIHLLHDSRGPVLESIVTRTLRQIEQTGKLVRLVGLSATLPNYEDVALFLRVKLDKGLFFFDNSYRPVPLQQQYIGITQKKAFKRHEIMNQICYEKVLNEAGKNQVLIFVHSRKETATTARTLRDMAMESGDIGKFIKDSGGRKELLTTEAESCKNDSLKDLLPHGFAIHHAGMTRADRTLVEELFADQHIQVLVSTSTLAWGVNLPAHTVIIKGTQVYNPEKGRWMELSPLDVMQMMGRAGRPQYDTSGEGIIITTHKELHYYLSLLNEQLPVESQFISKLADNLNAEIVLGAIQNVKEAVEWLRHTYLFVRMMRNPTLYGCTEDDLNEAEPLEQRRIDLIHAAAVLLDKNNLIKYDRKSGHFQVTDLGRVASHYYITHQSMAAFNDFLKPNVTDIELLRIFSLSSEFQHMTVREEEKTELAKLLDKVPIPVKESIEEPSAKVNVLLQAYISRLGLEGFALISDMVYITQSAGRVMRALFEIVLKRGWASAAVKCLNLCKMISHRMWGAQSPLRQFKGIPSDIIKRIEGKDFVWDRFYDLEAHAIGELIRFPKMGRTIHKAVHQLPRLELQGHVQPITRSVLRVELVLTPDFQFDEALHGSAEPFWVIVEDVDSETVLHHEYFVLSKKFANDAHTVTFTIPIHEPMPPQYFIRVVSDRWLGSEVVLPISFRHLILPERYAAPNDLLDLQPLHVNELASERFISFYEGRFEHFNPIQTQTFNSVYKRDDSVLVAAPTGSGKTVLAELAIMRALTKNPKARCIYIAPKQALVDERYADWSVSFGQKLGIPVTQLTGETTTDLKLLAAGQIVLSTPQTWDVMSRRWKTRKDVQTIALLIVDELHLIGGETGPVLEVVVSRTRYVATQVESATRIVGLCTSVANAKELGEWIGAKPPSTFCFQPNVRPVPLEIRVQGFDITHFESRVLAMAKPAYQQIKHLSPDKPVIIFVPSRKTAQSVAGDLLVFAASEKATSRFLHADPAELAPHLKHIKNRSLHEALLGGVAFYHKGLTEREKVIVTKLFSVGAIQVLVSEYDLCWGMTAAAQLVLLMDTQYYDGREHRYVDVPITDVMQMMGRASRPLIDQSGKFTIFCQSSKKEFYKKFLYEPFPVESHLDHYLADHINAEVVTKRIESVQDAVDYLTWSFYYRRITQNPNYYNLQGTSHRHLSDHLSELVEMTIDDLSKAKCINVEDETELSSLNLGMIAAYYYLRYTSLELFSASVKANTRHKGLLEILSNASEFDNIAVRHREDVILRTMSHHLPLAVPGAEAAGFSDSHVKTNLLLQAFFSRSDLSRNEQMKSDVDEILPKSLAILQSIVDVISSNRWLEPALAAMDLSQMVVQGLWNAEVRRDSPLLQLPHFSKELVQRCEKIGVTSVTGLIELEDDQRNQVLAGLGKPQLADIATMCNNFPDIECKFEVEKANEVSAGAPVKINVTLTRDPDADDDEEDATGVRKVSAPRYPQIKTEGWWLVIGNKEKNELLSIKRIAIKQKTEKFPLQFDAPDMGSYSLHLYLICDSYIGVDQDHELKLDVKQGVANAMADSDESD